MDFSPDPSPFFSILMACHNGEKFIEEAIQSVLRQSFKEWELIIVNDASQDSSLNIIKKYQKLDSRIKYKYSSVNIGAAAARNVAAELSTGKWIAILDADDIYMPDKLHAQFNLIKNGCKDLILVGCNCIHIDETGATLGVYKYPKSASLLKKNLLNFKGFPPHSSVVYRAKDFRISQGFNPKFYRSQDYDLWLRLSNQGKFANVYEPLLKYRIHASNISKIKTSEEFSQQIYGIAAKVCYLLRKFGCIDPSNSVGDDVWKMLLFHIKNKINQKDEVDYQNWKINFKAALQARNNGDGLYKLLKNFNICQSSYLFRLSKEFIFGSDLSNKCFKTWRAN